MSRASRFGAVALVAFAAVLAFDAWLRRNGFVSAAVMREWGDVVLYGDGKGSFRTFTTAYPPIEFALNVFAGVPVRALCSLPPPIFTAALLAALLAAMWVSALRAGGYGRRWSVVLTALVCLQPFFLYVTTTGVSAMLLLVAVYWLGTAYVASRTRGRVTDFMSLAFALAFTAFVHPLGAIVCVLALPFLAFALPPELIARSAVNSMLVLLFPLLFALGSFAYENALFQASAATLLSSVVGRFAAVLRADQADARLSALVEIAGPFAALSVVAMRHWAARRRHGAEVAALLLVCVLAGESLAILRSTGEPALWREAALGSSVAERRDVGVAAVGRFLAARTDVLIDASAHPEILAARGTTHGLVVPTDDTFKLTTLTRRIHSHFVAIPDPNGPAMLDDDLLTQMFPTLYERGMPGYHLTYDANGWRVYERNDWRNPV